MAKWFGIVGYEETKETSPGVWSKQITEQQYYGDTISNRWMNQSSNNVNDDININNQISIIADTFAYENFQHIRYAEFMGVKWNVSNVDVQYPRLILTLGGVYNE